VTGTEKSKVLIIIMGGCIGTQKPASKVFGHSLHGFIPEPVTRCLDRLENDPVAFASLFAPGSHSIVSDTVFVDDLENGTK
jgi:hypothetical protein